MEMAKTNLKSTAAPGAGEAESGDIEALAGLSIIDAPGRWCNRSQVTRNGIILGSDDHLPAAL